MLGTRLVLFVTLAALMAPWLAPCLVAAPQGHVRMACCRSTGGGSTVKPCCVSDEQRPAVPSDGAARLAQPDQPVGSAFAGVSATAFRLLRERSQPLPPLAPRELSRVLLI